MFGEPCQSEVSLRYPSKDAPKQAVGSVCGTQGGIGLERD
jgi:hypothetical protein